jgi:hypothetical protein
MVFGKVTGDALYKSRSLSMTLVRALSYTTEIAVDANRAIPDHSE